VEIPPLRASATLLQLFSPLVKPFGSEKNTQRQCVSWVFVGCHFADKGALSFLSRISCFRYPRRVKPGYEEKVWRLQGVSQQCEKPESEMLQHGTAYLLLWKP
jgi:hypothetical protein